MNIGLCGFNLWPLTIKLWCTETEPIPLGVNSLYSTWIHLFIWAAWLSGRRSSSLKYSEPFKCSGCQRLWPLWWMLSSAVHQRLTAEMLAFPLLQWAAVKPERDSKHYKDIVGVYKCTISVNNYHFFHDNLFQLCPTMLYSDDCFNLSLFICTRPNKWH